MEVICVCKSLKTTQQTHSNQLLKTDFYCRNIFTTDIHFWSHLLLVTMLLLLCKRLNLTNPPTQPCSPSWTCHTYLLAGSLYCCRDNRDQRFINSSETGAPLSILKKSQGKILLYDTFQWGEALHSCKVLQNDNEGTNKKKKLEKEKKNCQSQCLQELCMIWGLGTTWGLWCTCCVISFHDC